MCGIILIYSTKNGPRGGNGLARASSVEAGRLVRMLSQWSLEGMERNEIILCLL